jgi:hypothetical protein
METDEDEDVRWPAALSAFLAKHHAQGIEGEVKFSGSTPELDDFILRVVDGTFCDGYHLSFN